MSHWWCCCSEPGCTIAEDYFTPAPLEDLGSGWHVLEGDWHRSNDTVWCPKTDPPCAAQVPCAHAKATTEPPGRNVAVFLQPHRVADASSMHVRMRIIEEAPRQYYWLLLAVEYDPDTRTLGNHLSATYYTGDPDTGTSAYIELIQHTGAGDTSLEKLDVDNALVDDCDGRIFDARFGSDGFCAHIGTAVLAFVWDETEDPFEITQFPVRSGMGASGEAPFRVEWFNFSEHYDTNPDCAFCRCTCDAIPLPDILTVTIRATGCLAAMDGCEFKIEYDSDMQYWQIKGGDHTFACDCCSWNVQFSCSGKGSLEDMELTYVSGNCMDPYSSGPYTPDANDSTCSPIYFKFVNPATGEPWVVGSLTTDCCPGVPPPAGTFWLEITA